MVNKFQFLRVYLVQYKAIDALRPSCPLYSHSCLVM